MDVRVVALLFIIPVVVLANKKETICEGREARLHCRKGTVKIQGVMYGRQSKKPCRDVNANNINCSSGKAERILKRQCNGNKRCTVRADNGVLGGDPCPGTSKYLEVKWKCQA